MRGGKLSKVLSRDFEGNKDILQLCTQHVLYNINGDAYTIFQVWDFMI